MKMGFAEQLEADFWGWTTTTTNGRARSRTLP